MRVERQANMLLAVTPEAFVPKDHRSDASSPW